MQNKVTFTSQQRVFKNRTDLYFWTILIKQHDLALYILHKTFVLKQIFIFNQLGGWPARSQKENLNDSCMCQKCTSIDGLS